jgi:putative oxidoreductase
MAALAESVGGVLFAAGVLFRPACLAMLGVMIVATIEQSGRAEPMPEHALKNAFVLAGMFLIGPGRYTAAAMFAWRGRRR